MFPELGSPTNVDNQFTSFLQHAKEKYYILYYYTPSRSDDDVFIGTPVTRYSIKIISASGSLNLFLFSPYVFYTKLRGLIGFPKKLPFFSHSGSHSFLSFSPKASVYNVCLPYFKHILIQF